MGKRSNSYADSRRYYDWLDRAEEDIASAKALSEHENCYNNAAFHCQQTVEKALKAYILLRSDLLVDGHNLPWLCKRAGKYDSTFLDWLGECASLSKCYIETRYPADIPLDLTQEQVLKYYQMAREMYCFICDEVAVSLAEKKNHPVQKSKSE